MQTLELRSSGPFAEKVKSVHQGERLTRVFLLIAFLSALAGGLSIVWVWRTVGQRELFELRTTEQGRLAQAGGLIVEAMTHMRGDALHLASLPSIENAFESDSAMLEASRVLLRFAYSRPRYAQIRLLDAGGCALLREEPSCFAQ